ncbi:sel1 repeat family protein [Campylobacter sp. FMV-PI01]|uniref:beta-lactamase n=1 Tax=Campylobacter portucalensis TaxID=2608384 RepID=A0A6L5WJP9_9BACT|nr:sel1 repeat family protein [Campylobacter portucalensis]
MLLFLSFVIYIFGQNFEDEIQKRIFENPKFIDYDNNCTNGDSWACSEVGMTYYKYQKNDKALQYFTKACDIKFGVGCELKSFMLMTKGEFKEPFEIFTKSCENNSSYGCLNLAKMYDLGYETNINKQKATDLYIKSCKLGDRGACEMLNVR